MAKTCILDLIVNDDGLAWWCRRMQIFWGILLPTFFVSFVALGLLMMYSLYIVFGGLPSLRKKAGNKKLPLVTTASSSMSHR